MQAKLEQVKECSLNHGQCYLLRPKEASFHQMHLDNSEEKSKSLIRASAQYDDTYIF